MGILNCTPDSFYDGGNYVDKNNEIDFGKLFSRALAIESEGATLLDIGAESTRPGSRRVSLEEEKARISPLLAFLKNRLTIALSIETAKPEVARLALDAGASLINDSNCCSDPKMRALVKASGVKVCLMHMQGSPETMQRAPSYPKGVVPELLDWFEKKIEQLTDEGIGLDQIVVDPGIGFGKSVEDNISILKNLSLFERFGAPVLIGLSRKSFMQKILGKTASDLLSTTLALNTMCLLSGASIIRVHDVKEHRDVLDMLQVIETCPSLTLSLSSPHC